MKWKFWQKKGGGGIGREDRRKIRANDPQFNAAFNYATNAVSTSKYNLVTFVPKNLFEQFQRLANAYFLVLLILQLIPQISSLNPITTILPLSCVLILKGLKDLIDDIARHRNDNLLNTRPTLVLRGKNLRKEQWCHIVVGDIIKLEKDEFVAADLLLLASSEPHGLCYIETAELDGETNLKVKQALSETVKHFESIAAKSSESSINTELSKLDFEIECEAPNELLNQFEGTLTFRNASSSSNYTLNTITNNGTSSTSLASETTVSLDNDKMLLRGCRLRNTNWCYGLVVFAGSDTKLMKNGGKTKFKQTHIDKLLNYLIIGIVLFLLTMCAICTIACGIWESVRGYHFQVYLPWESFVSDDKDLGSAVISLLVFLSYLIILNTVVPISLYVSIEFIRSIQSLWINWDIKMYYDKADIPAKARTTTLNEELGQIEYIFSDKTGTLTQNIMTFNKCSINGALYGYLYDKDNNEIEITDQTPCIDFAAFNRYAEPAFRFYDRSLLEAIQRNEPHCCRFFLLLCLCHTVMAEEKLVIETVDIDSKATIPPGAASPQPTNTTTTYQLTYQAQSPDEGALVSAARNFGFVFKSRTPKTITCMIKGEEKTYEVLNILDFNNVRKRMSVIVRLPPSDGGGLVLFCKGADTVIKERLAKQELLLFDHSEEHLNKFAEDALRTLCLAWREIDEIEYAKWAEDYHEASTSLDDRANKVSQVYEKIERELRFVGSTAIEDKLQDGVPECIAKLAKANIKIWVLTGDKLETAINIGYSAQLLTNDMDVYTIECDNEQDLLSEIQAKKRIIEEAMLLKQSIYSASHFSSIPATQNTYLQSPSTMNTVFSPNKSIGNASSTFSNLNNYNIAAAEQMLHLKPVNTSKQSFKYYEDINNNNTSSFMNSPLTAAAAAAAAANAQQQASTTEFALVITGQSLVHALTPRCELQFLELACMCKAVICCRVTPGQKKAVVDLVKTHKKAITLAIGDGANDVSMIKSAHIGVGISGQEGQQAVLASDFSIGQFRYLERLLLVHGRWSYYRISKFLRYFFYKNFASTLCHFWFAFYCGFSATPLFDPFFVSTYNVFFSSLPVLALGVFDQDVNEELSVKYPTLYLPGQKSTLFNRREFLFSVMHGIITSLVVFFVPYGTMYHSVEPSGKDASDLQSFGFAVATILVIVVNLQCGLDTSYWTGFNHFCIWGTLIVHFIFHFALYSEYVYQIFGQGWYYIGTAQAVCSVAVFWFTVLLTSAILLLPIIAYRFVRLDMAPGLADKVRIVQKYGEKTTKSKSTIFATRPRAVARSSMRASARSQKRSPYAFSHQEGFADLIKQGKMMPEPSVINKNNSTKTKFNQLNKSRNNLLSTELADHQDHQNSSVKLTKLVYNNNFY